jgi:protein SCO1/2
MKKLLTLAMLTLLAACSQPSFKNVDITGSKSFGNNFVLLDSQGKDKTIADFKGKAVVLFFGYTHCPDVCPTALYEIGQIYKALGPEGDRLKTFFISVDPERDTPDVLKTYLSGFDPRITGLSGSLEAVAAAEKAYRAYAKKVPLDGGSYTMDHTALIYLMSRKGRFLSSLNVDRPPEENAKLIASYF